MYNLKKTIIKRTSILPKTQSKLMNNFDTVNDYDTYVINSLNNPIFYEALLIACPSFLNGIEKFDSKKVIDTLSNYLNRIYYRPTPFGLFSSVSVINNDKYLPKRKFIKPSGSWFNKLLTLIESNEEFMMSEPYKWNHMILNVGDKLYLTTSSCIFKDTKNSEDFREYNKIIIDNQVLALVKEISNDRFITLSEISLKLHEVFNININVINNFLFELVKEEILISNNRSILSTLNLEKVINKLKTIESLTVEKKKLEIIQDLFYQYQMTDLGEGIDILNEIYKEMSFIEDENPISVNTRGVSKNDLMCTYSKDNENILNRIENAVNILMKVEVDDNGNYPYIDNYIEKFKNRFGSYEYVPLLDLLNPQVGLGNPYQFIIKPNEREYNKTFKKFIINKVINAIKKSELNIYLTKSELQQFFTDNNKYPDSFELFFKKSNLNSSIFPLLVPNSATDRYGKSIGRFADMFEFENLDIFKDNLVDIYEVPKDEKLLNLINLETTKTNKININYDDNLAEISLNNILVKCENNQFLFYDSKTGEEIEFSLNNSLNYSNSNNLTYISRFLLESTSNKYINPLKIQNLIDEVIKDIGYCPNIILEGVIIYPEKYIYKKNDFQLKRNFDQFLEEWNVPSLIIYSEQDRYLYYNLENASHINSLRKKIEHNRSKYVEIYSQKNFLNDNNYSKEYVIGFEKNNKDIDVKKVNQNITMYHGDTYILGDEWISLKYYGLGFNQKEFLTIHLTNFINKLIDQNIIDKFYYLSYADPESHIRLRIQLKEKKDFNSVFTSLLEFNSKMREKELFNKVVFDSYTRELGRYGGIELIDYIENIFFKDSIYCLKFLSNSHSYNKTELYRNIITSSFELLFELELDAQYIIDILSVEIPTSKANQIYREIKHSNPKFLTSLSVYLEECKSYNIENIENFNKVLKRKTENQKQVIYRSILHMHFNRLLIDNKTEENLTEIIYKFGKNLNYLNKI